MQDLEKILEEMRGIKDGNRKEDLYAKYPPNSKNQGILNAYSQGYEDGTDNFYNATVEIIRKRMNDGWIPVEERLPDEEAEEYIKKKLHGIGYLYPCLVTYRSPMTERIHVVRFYYDIYEHWFVNAGEEVCEKERCIAWRPLPEPYTPKRNKEE